ncbi:MAG: hypothetical protein ACRDJC_18805 [Thermomicrobiales bacterium]
MTRLGQLAVTGLLVVLILALTILTRVDGDSARQTTWGSAYAFQDPDPGFWGGHQGRAAEAPHLYAAGMSRFIATSRVTVLPHSGLELRNFGAPGALVIESGGLLLTDAEGIVELQRGAASVAMELAPAGIGSRLERGDRIAYHSSASIALRNPEATAASLLVVTEHSDLPPGGARQ